MGIRTFKFLHATQLAVIFMLLCCPVNSHRILGLFPHPGMSHFQFFHPVMKALAEAGHEVTVLSHFPSKVPIDNYRDEVLSGEQDLTNFVNLEVSGVPNYSGTLPTMVWFSFHAVVRKAQAVWSSVGILYAIPVGTRSMWSNLEIISFKEHSEQRYFLNVWLYLCNM